VISARRKIIEGSLGLAAGAGAALFFRPRGGREEGPVEEERPAAPVEPIVPERRSHTERRSGSDRRAPFSVGTEHATPVVTRIRSSIDRRSGLDRRSLGDRRTP
jgi:hypothetical protein